MLTDEKTGPDQRAVLHRMTPAAKWKAIHAMYWTLRRHKAGYLRSRHPDWTEEQIQSAVREIFLHART